MIAVHVFEVLKKVKDVLKFFQFFVANPRYCNELREKKFLDFKSNIVKYKITLFKLQGTIESTLIKQKNIFKQIILITVC